MFQPYLVDCISELPPYELTTPANIADSTVALNILEAINQTISIRECTFLAQGLRCEKHLQHRESRLRWRSLYPAQSTALQRRPRGSLRIIRSVRRILRCTKMVKRPTVVVPIKNSAVSSDNPKPDTTPATTKTGTMTEKTVTVRNTSPSLLTTDFPLTRNACILSTYMPYVMSVSQAPPPLRLISLSHIGHSMEFLAQPCYPSDCSIPLFYLSLYSLCYNTA